MLVAATGRGCEKRFLRFGLADFATSVSVADGVCRRKAVHSGILRDAC